MVRRGARHLPYFLVWLLTVLMGLGPSSPPSINPAAAASFPPGLYGPNDICSSSAHRGKPSDSGHRSHACCWWLCGGGTGALPATAASVPLPTWEDGPAIGPGRIASTPPQRPWDAHRPRAPPRAFLSA